MKLLAATILLCAVGYGQSRPSEIQDRFENIDFASGQAGVMPPGWRLGPEGTALYLATTAAGGSCLDGKQCAQVQSIGTTPAGLCFLYQVVDATPYRGKQLAYRAAVRADVTAAGLARLLVRVHRTDGSTSFRDDMGHHPITSGPWSFYEIDAPIAPDARDIEFGLQLFGDGAAWIDKISLAFADPRAQADDRLVRALIEKFAALRNAHDGPAVAALYSEDGEWLGARGQGATRGRTALAQLWGGVSGRVERTIQSLDFPGPNIAVVHVITQYAEPVGQHHEVFVTVKEDGVWLIRVHQSVD
jgi:uncharacterized protein (TIGR02246 family)